MSLVPVLLAGGEGRRLGPLGSHRLPKQFHHFGHRLSLLQQTVGRALRLAPADRIITITAERYAQHAYDQLAAIDKRLTHHLVAEPLARNTAAAVSLASHYAESHFGQTTLSIFPADHKIEAEETFAMQVQKAAVIAREGRIVLFGIRPSFPSSHYGYMLHAEDSRTVTAFHEKPGTDLAAALIATGRAYWNSGMFVMTSDICLEELRRHVPQVFLSGRDAARALSLTPKGWQITEPRFYESVPPIPIDKAVMEKSRRLAIVPLMTDWADLGTWEEVKRVTGLAKNH